MKQGDWGEDDIVRPGHCQFEGTPGYPEEGVCSQVTFRMRKLVLVSVVNREMGGYGGLAEGSEARMMSGVLLRAGVAGASGHQEEEGRVGGSRGRWCVQVWRFQGQWNVHGEVSQGQLAKQGWNIGELQAGDNGLEIKL